MTIETTYRLASGELIYGEYSTVTQTEFFEGVDEPTEVVAETWMLVGTKTMVFGR